MGDLVARQIDEFDAACPHCLRGFGIVGTVEAIELAVDTPHDLPDDNAILEARGGCLLIEAGFWRACLPGGALDMSIVESNGSQCLRIESRIPEIPWGITAKHSFLSQGMSGGDKRLPEKLWRELYDGLARPGG